MKIHKTAWHFRLARVFDSGYVPRDLCSYFWRVVGTLLFFILTSPILLVLFPVWALAAFIKARIPKRAKREPAPPSLFMAWLTAKKKHICPLIAVVE